MDVREREKNIAMHLKTIQKFMVASLADTYGMCAAARLIVEKENAILPEVIERINRAARWFELPHPTISGRFLDGEQDFQAQVLIRLIYECENILPEETKKLIYKFFTENELESKYKSENHMLMFHSNRYLFALRYPSCFFNQYGLSAKEVLEIDREFIRKFIEFRAQRGWAEFDSLGYAPEVFNVLLSLYDYGEEKMSHYAGMAANVILLDMLMDSSRTEGLYGGAHGRVYDDSVEDLKTVGMYKLYQYYFGDEECEGYFEPVISNFLPADYVYDVFNNRPECWENRECKHLHSITCPVPHKQVPQVPGSINKQTYVTPDYILGGVTWQDKYPKDSEAAWYAHHQQHEWELTILPDSRLRIFSHHPGLPTSGPTGHEHGYWTGDLGCCCGQFFNEKNVAMAMYDIPEREADFIHVRVPFEHIESAEQEGNCLWIKAQRVYVMLWLSEGICKGGKGFENVEIRSYGRKHGVVCMVASQKDFEGMGAFKKAAQAGHPTFDKESMRLVYENIEMTPDERVVGGIKMVFPYETYDSPCVFSKHGSGVIETRLAVLDFIGWGKIIYNNLV